MPHKVNTWTTDGSGTVMTGKELDPGDYQLEEITAPNGYVLNIAPVKFKVSSNTAYETLPDGATPVITVTKQDT
ncbi:prealbumin-like fold domain-containing protein, partial [Erysipelatoclostridium ramosum]|uniref:prealbumin-like fold domain-containing protein n=1 Tax=Thomasclavelia ramosa TaxID=1547 RepID=UPI001D06ADEC|nr:prealbumin-like fold domain-containing protein [Thomasclavelia ramosa]